MDKSFLEMNLASIWWRNMLLLLFLFHFVSFSAVHRSNIHTRYLCKRFFCFFSIVIPFTLAISNKMHHHTEGKIWWINYDVLLNNTRSSLPPSDRSFLFIFINFCRVSFVFFLFTFQQVIRFAHAFFSGWNIIQQKKVWPTFTDR